MLNVRTLLSEKLFLFDKNSIHKWNPLYNKTHNNNNEMKKTSTLIHQQEGKAKAKAEKKMFLTNARFKNGLQAARIMKFVWHRIFN